MRAALASRSRDAASGFILIAVLWIVAALATLASIYSIYAINTTASSHLADERLQAEASIRSGVELAVFQLLGAPEGARPTHGAFEARVGRTKIAVRYRTERALVDLNAAPKELLAGLLVAVGVGAATAADYAGHIVAWRTKPDPNKADNEEASAYKAAGLKYPPRQGPFNDPLELSLVLGLPPKIVERILPDVTIFSKAAQVDVITADPEVLAALPGMTPDILNNVLHVRGDYGENRQPVIALLGAAGQSAATEPGKAFRAFVLVDLRRGRRVSAEVVFTLADGAAEEPYKILYWRDDFDGPFASG
jgi:general secretion pathway protein K